ncbi:SRPBCC family protein, partial [Micromonospora sp. WMMD737]|uniref:SRPBCC family protein n=1 Tax=Micromonospora sp. WMMD737 TaxID=3404113 RepID=UPI003B9268ED
PGLIAGLDRDVALGDGINGFGLIDLDEEAVATAGDPIGTPEAAAALLAAALDRANPRVRLLGVEKDSISVVVHEQDSPAFDYLVLSGQSVADAVELAERGAVDPANGVSELVIATGDGGRVVATGGAAFDGVLVRGLGAEITEDELPILLRSLARRPGVNAVDQGDTVRFEIRGSDGTVDVIVFETDRAPGNGGYDVGFLRAQRHDEFAGLLGDLHRRPLATLAEQVQYTLSDVLNFAFSVPALRALFEAIAPGLNLADAEPLTEQPVVDVANGVPETAAVTVPLGEFVFEIGDTFAVGTEGGFSLLSSLLALPISELSGILRAEVDADDNDNDAQQLLEEILNGRSGAQLDFESEPGIDGVQLVGLTPVSFTLAFADGVQTDRLTFEGPGSEAILAGFDARGGADLADGQNNLSLIDVGSEELVLGDGPANPIFDLFGDGFAGDADLAALIAAVTGGSNPAVSLVSQDAGSISVRIDNPVTGEFDLLVFYDPTGATDLL